MRQALIALTLLLVLTGCAVGPDYKKPEIASPPAWLVDMQTAKDTANTPWWEQFNDPALNDLIQTALQQNYDLRIATARVDEYYGRYGATRADLFPQIGYGASADRTQLSEKGSFAGIPGAGTPHPTLASALRPLCGDQLKLFLQVDGEEEFTVYLAPVGKLDAEHRIAQ